MRLLKAWHVEHARQGGGHASPVCGELHGDGDGAKGRGAADFHDKGRVERFERLASDFLFFSALRIEFAQ